MEDDYVIEVWAPATTWLTLAGDEDDDDGDMEGADPRDALPPTTSDPELALRFATPGEAETACWAAAARFPRRAFRVGRARVVTEVA